jgi:formamidopyrimidine-DNA glycosylase
MPELPDLEIIREYLAPRLVGERINAAQVLSPLVVRDMLAGDTAQRLVGRSFASIARRGKFLMMALDDGSKIVINPMLAGRIRYGKPLSRSRKRDALVLGLESGTEFRYHDAKDMGKIYFTHDPAQVPGFTELGPEANDPALTLSVFRERLRRHRGEIKGILTNQLFLAGIGNAYADEICWHAGIYPFRRRPDLSDDEIVCLHRSILTVLTEAITVLRSRVGDAIDVEVRDFLAVHGRPNQPCPRCDGTISEVKRHRRKTHFCRTCQPGLLIG